MNFWPFRTTSTTTRGPSRFFSQRLPAAKVSKLSPDLAKVLRGDDFHERVKTYLEDEGCLEVSRFRTWVDEAKEWNDLLSGPHFRGVKRKHRAFIKERWESVKMQWEKEGFEDMDGGDESYTIMPSKNGAGMMIKGTGNAMDDVLSNIPGLSGGKRSMMFVMGKEGENSTKNGKKSNAWGLGNSSSSKLDLSQLFGMGGDNIIDIVGHGRDKRTEKTFMPVNQTNVTFDDVKGCDEAKEEMKEVVMYLKDPKRFTRLGAKLPKGILMTGAPGTGKTLMARAVAGEANATFIQTCGSEFEEEFVGVGARRIRDLFQEARKHSPCVVFIDELDAVGGKRNSRDNVHHRQTLNQLLVEVDGFKQNDALVLIAATNFPESLDKALTRAGRIDKTVVLPLPDLKGRQDILQLYAKNITLGCDVHLDVVAQRTTGMTGADLANILNIAAIRSSVDQLPAVSMIYLEDAFDRVVVGATRRSPMSDHEKNTTAYHEGGHALVGWKTHGADPVHKATIMPRGTALGITWSVPETEKFSHRLFEFQAQLDMMMGGRAAEELVFGPQNVSAGCSSDLHKATDLARQMVMNFGMGGGTDPVSMYFETMDYQMLSDKAKHDLDTKVQSLLRDAYTRAVDCLKQHEGELHLLAEALMKYETLDKEEIRLAVSGKKSELEERHKNATALRNLTRLNDTLGAAFRKLSVNRTLGNSTQKSKEANSTQKGKEGSIQPLFPIPNLTLNHSLGNSTQKNQVAIPVAGSTLSDLEPRGNDYFFLGLGAVCTLAFFILTLVGLKKRSGFQKSVQALQEPLMYA